MSVWSTIKATISFKHNESINVKKFAGNYFDEYSVTAQEFHLDNCKTIDFDISFCMDGEEAMKTSTDFLNGLKALVPSVMIEADIQIRWIT